GTPTAAAANRPGSDRRARGTDGSAAAGPEPGPGGEGAGHRLPGRAGAPGDRDRHAGRADGGAGTGPGAAARRRPLTASPRARRETHKSAGAAARAAEK